MFRAHPARPNRVTGPLEDPHRARRVFQPMAPAAPSHPHAGDPVFDLHVGGKMEIRSTVSLDGPDDLSMAYTPGVARVCEAIAADPSMTQHYTWVPEHGRRRHRRHRRPGPRRHRARRGDAGDGGQGRAVQAVRRRRRRADLPGHHRHRGDHRDRRPAGAELRRDQPRGHLRARAASRSRRGSRSCSTSRSSTTTSTAPPWWSLAALENALRLTGRTPATTRVVDRRRRRGRGGGDQDPARGRHRGPRRRRPPGRPHSARGDLTPVKRALAETTADLTGRSGSLADVLVGADVFIGVSGGTVPEEHVATMAPESIIFGLANPTPEVHPDVAPPPRPRRRHRPLGLPEPDQQRAGLPGHLPRAPSTRTRPRSPRA